MTTIAYKSGVIAYDSRACKENLIVTDHYDKQTKHEGWRFFLSGDLCDTDDLIEKLVSGRGGAELNVSGYAVDPAGVLWDVGGGGGPWMLELPLDVPRACGSGSDFALAAMDFGCSAKKAVQYAMTRDNATGGKVRTYKLKEHEA